MDTHADSAAGPSLGRFVDKVAIVTGGSSGIGLAAARRMFAEGARVVVAARSVDRGNDAARSIDPTGERALFVTADMTNRAAIDALFNAAMERFGRLDVVVNAVGSLHLSSLEQLSPTGWQRVIASNLTSVFESCQAAVPHLRATIGSGQAEGAAIVNVTSIDAVAGDRLMGAYSAAKAGLLNLTRSLALELASERIRVNSVAPGAVDTPMTAFHNGPSDLLDAFSDAIPMGRVAQPHEIAAAIAFMAADEASFVTGANLIVDGGLTAATGHPDLTRFERRSKS
jgi:meso-butanediol dehydrogenase / (S,S)-butanediol dehydrogenase / diacetyl reductase